MQYTASDAVLSAIEALLARHRASFERGEEGRSLYALVDAKAAADVRAGLWRISLRHPGDALRIRWTGEDSLSEEPEEASVMDGAFMYPGEQDVLIAWTGPWPGPDVRAAANAVLRESLARMRDIPGARDAAVVMNVGDAQVRATASQGSPQGQAEECPGMAEGFRNEHFARLLGQRA
ncbi:MAG TPA: hypothetical protein VLA21_02670 [Candidatus Limnocylindria bacterium]|nr:hypothetical protein [Candidatus Limnocylindria bacterium]